MSIFNKQIHRDDFRLRLLVTDACNKDCHHCLNDFQPKPGTRVKFLSPTVAKRIIRDYCLLTGSKAQVDISGGEPGIYPYLKDVVRYAKDCGAIVKISTNGMAFGWDINRYVDHWHVGVTRYDKALAEATSMVNGRIQIVVTDNILGPIYNTVALYGLHSLPIKLFVDFFATGKEKKDIELVIASIIRYYTKFDISTRHTGVQENRGVLCDGCTRKCITLKALWVFPDNKVSQCPHGEVSRRAFDNNSLRTARDIHLVK